MKIMIDTDNLDNSEKEEIERFASRQALAKKIGEYQSLLDKTKDDYLKLKPTRFDKIDGKKK